MSDPKIPESFEAGKTAVRIARDEAAMGQATAAFVAAEMRAAADRGERPALWLMAAPSGFAFYAAFARLAEGDRALAALCREAAYFQFDDYPIPRGDPRFPVTFRHLLETRFFAPLSKACGKLGGVRLLEIGGGLDQRVCEEYAASILEAAADPRVCLIQLKGIGMDGHWGFHGHETPLDTPPAIVSITMNSANVHQQRLDWPQYFKSDDDVPKSARTCDVSLFLKARVIVDNVPQSSKIYSVLATYGNARVSGLVPSTALKTHPRSFAYLTEASASALVEYRRALARDPGAKVGPGIMARLEAIWESGEPGRKEANVLQMRAALRDLGML